MAGVKRVRISIGGKNMEMRLSEIKGTEPIREHGDIKSLADSIQKDGLLHPLVVNQNKELVCGRRRFEAVKSLGWETVPVVMITTTDDIDKLSKTLAENIERKNLDWQEEVKAKAEIDQLMREKYGSVQRGGDRKSYEHKNQMSDSDIWSQDKPMLDSDIGWKQDKTAELLNQSRSLITEDIQLANALDKYPELKKSKTKSEAKRRLARIKKLENKPKIESDIKPMIKHGDFRELIRDIPDNSIDLVFTDPPYGKEYLDLWETLAQESARVLKPGKFLITYVGKSHLPEVINSLNKHLSYYWICSMEFKNGQVSVFDKNIWTKFRPILIYSNPPVIRPEWFCDVIISPEVHKEMHEWGQNVEPIKYLLKAFTNAGDTVLDPMVGGGSTVEACVELKRNVLGFDIDEKSIENILRRFK